MQSRSKGALRVAALGALLAALAAPGVARADTVATDGDAVSAGPQSSIDLGSVAPSTLISLEVPFTLVCSNGSHLDPGQAVVMEAAGGVVPAGGEIVSVSGGSTAAAPVDWTVDGVLCPAPAPTVVGGTPATVVLRAPAADGQDLEFLVTWTRSLSPAGSGDTRALSGAPSLTVRLDVVSDTPPVLTAPASLIVEANTLGGWVVDLAGVVLVDDAEDDPDPAAVCDAAEGAVLGLGSTTVTCTATDTDGAIGSTQLEVQVVDTTAPTLQAIQDMRIETGDPAGTLVAFAPPVASDTVDADPSVICLPASGSTFAVGTTTVICTATDASGNASATTFDVQVVDVPPVVASASWLEPVGVGNGGRFVANRGRNVPVKVVLAVDGVARTTGTARLALVPCAGGVTTRVGLGFAGGRWNGALDTGTLGHACYDVTVTIDGLGAGGFRLELRGAEATMTKARGR